MQKCCNFINENNNKEFEFCLNLEHHLCNTELYKNEPGIYVNYIKRTAMSYNNLWLAYIDYTLENCTLLK